MSSNRFTQSNTYRQQLNTLLQAILLTMLVCLLFGPPIAQAFVVPTGVTQKSTVEGITEFTLPNGLRVLLSPDDSKPTTTVNMTYLVGSRHENYGETGMAHLLEHMMFKGTPTHQNALGEFSKRGIQANGSTWLDRTNYYGTFSANPDTLEWFLGWQADAMINSTILRTDLDSEMTVVRNEMESGENNPFRILMEKTQATAFQWHNYGKSTIGARADVENVDTNRLKAFYQQYYQPDNAVLVITGSFDSDKTLALVNQIFSSIPKPTRILPRLYTTEPVQDGARQVTLTRIGGTPLLMTLYHIPQAADPRFIDLDLASIMLSDTPSGRLHKALVETKIASSSFGGTYELHDPGMAMFGVKLPANGDINQAKPILLNTLENIAKQPFTAEELKRAKNLWMQSWQRTFDNPQALGIALSETIAAGDWRLFFLQRDRVEQAQLDSIQKTTQQYLVEANRTLGIYIPTDKPTRAPTASETTIEDLFNNYQGRTTAINIRSFDPSPANIQQLTQRGVLDLPHGKVEFALLPKETRGNRVSASIVFRFGDVNSLKGLGDIASATAYLLDKGTKTQTRQQIEDMFTEQDATVNFSGAATSLSITISTKREQLPQVIKQALDVVKNANFPAAQLDEYKQSMLTGLESARHDPQSIASLALSRHRNPWKPDDIRYVSNIDESIASIKSLTPDQLKSFHTTFYGASNVLLAAVGDFDAQQVKSVVQNQLQTWHAAPAYTRVPDPFHNFEPTRINNETPDKANAFYISTASVSIQATDDDYIALNLGNYLLGLSESSRLWNRIREQDGLSYNIRSILDASYFEKNASWTIYAIFAPEVKDKLEQGIKEEIARVLNEGFTEQEVQNGIQSILNMRRIARSQDGSLVSAWMLYMGTNRDFLYAKDADERLSKLTAKDVNDVMKRYLKPESFTTSVAGDFNKKK